MWQAGEWYVLVHYLSKFMDWFDTLWMVLKKKSHVQMSFLHLYHHGERAARPLHNFSHPLHAYHTASRSTCTLRPVTGCPGAHLARATYTPCGDCAPVRFDVWLVCAATIGVVWGYLLSTGNGNGTAQYGAFINSVTHVIMYTHFLWTSFGYKNPFKNLVTTWQITQFYSCFLQALIVLSAPPSPATRSAPTACRVRGGAPPLTFPTPTPTPKPPPAEYEEVLPRKYAWLQFCYHITMIYLFTFKLHWVPNVLKDPAMVKAKGEKTKEVTATPAESAVMTEAKKAK